MKMYNVLVLDHTMEETKALLERYGYSIIHEKEKACYGESVRELGVLVVKGSENPEKYGIHRSRPSNDGEQLYFW